jgi:hypothetical protein
MIRLPLLKSPAAPSTSSRAVDIGWLLDSEKASMVWEAPRRISRNEPTPEHSKAVSYCPAVVDHEARMFEVPCPIDVNLGFRFDDKEKPSLINLDGDKSAIRPRALNDMLAIIGRREWRHPDRPIIQLITPYLFLADQPVYMTQLPPFLHYHMNQWPGVMIGGRLPIHIWPRQMMWAFEWFDIKKPLSLRRGEPWFYVRFETEDPSRPVRLVEAEWTDELKQYKNSISAVANYMNRTFSLFKTAEARRPKTLLKRKGRS